MAEDFDYQQEKKFPLPLGSSRVVTISRPLAAEVVWARGPGIIATRLEPSGGNNFL